MREIVLDTETTGIDPAQGHRIIEIGALEIVNQRPTGAQLHLYINPEREVEAGALEVHGLSNEFLEDKPLFADIVDEFLEFIGKSSMVIHNAPFDMGFINSELKRLGREELPMSRATDTLTMARRKFPGAQANLNALCRRFDIDNSHRDLHGALVDADLLASVYLELLGGRQRNLSLEPDKTVRKTDDKGQMDRPKALSFRPTLHVSTGRTRQATPKRRRILRFLKNCRIRSGTAEPSLLSGFRAGIRAVSGLLAFQVVLVDRDEIDRLDAERHETAIPCHVGNDGAGKREHQPRRLDHDQRVQIIPLGARRRHDGGIGQLCKEQGLLAGFCPGAERQHDFILFAVQAACADIDADFDIRL